MHLKKIITIALVIVGLMWSTMALAADLPEVFSQAGMTELSTPGSKNITVADGTVCFTGKSEAQRLYLRTTRSDFSNTNFQVQVTVTVHGGGGIGSAFFGLGNGTADSGRFGEPSAAPSIYLRVIPSDFGGGVAAIFDSQDTVGQDLGTVGDGTHRVRMTWDAASKRALFEICKNWNGKTFKADGCATIRDDFADFNGNNTHLFIGGAGGGKFADLSIKTMSEADIKAINFGETFSHDPTAATWLPIGKDKFADPALAQADTFLKALSGRMRLLACWYSGAQLAATRSFANGELHTDGSKWAADVHAAPVADDPDALDLDIAFKLTDGVARSAGVAVAFDIADWSADNYVLIPASIYNGNRNRIEHRSYASGLNREDLYKKDLQLTTTDLPQLSPEPYTPSKVEVNVCNATTPALCFYNRKTKRAFIVLAPQGTQLGDNGLSIEESLDRTHATLVVSAPGVRERKPEFIGFSGSPDRGANWNAGDEVKLHLRIYSFATPEIPGLLEKFMTVRKDVTGPNHPRNLIPLSEVTKLLANRIDSRFYNGQDSQFYCCENAAWISFGWVGGLMDTYPMLVLGDATRLEHVTKTFDFAIAHAQGKAGYFYGALNHDGKPFGREGYGEHPEICLTRKNADVLFWMLKQFMVLKAQGRTSAIKPEWEQSIKRLTDAFVATWKKDGQWGNFVNIDTGEVAIYNTSSGVLAAGGLALASEYFHEPEYLKIAKEAADFYYQRDFVNLGMTTGACADILQNADSETAAGFMTALMALYDTTGDAQWLEKSRNLANLAATWTISYDYEFPPQYELYQLGAKMAGAVWASTQNKHGAPGFCTSSGDPLFKIYRATGDLRYADLMRDVIHAHAEGLHPDGEITERLTYCDADSRGTRGGGSTGWNELNGILMAMELPGIYLRTDKDMFYVFDHVAAKVIKRDDSGVTFEITNPTKFEARVSIFAETAQDAQKPLGYTAFLKWPKVAINAGQTIEVHVSATGAILSR